MLFLSLRLYLLVFLRSRYIYIKNEYNKKSSKSYKKLFRIVIKFNLVDEL